MQDRTFDLLGEIAAGVRLGSRWGRGTAVMIMTGAPMPAGADGVVPVESRRSLEASPPRVTLAHVDGRRDHRQPRIDVSAGSSCCTLVPRLVPQLAVAASVIRTRCTLHRAFDLKMGNEIIAG